MLINATRSSTIRRICSGHVSMSNSARKGRMVGVFHTSFPFLSVGVQSAE